MLRLNYITPTRHALEALLNALYKFKTYLLTYLLTHLVADFPRNFAAHPSAYISAFEAVHGMPSWIIGAALAYQYRPAVPFLFHIFGILFRLSSFSI